MRYFLLLLEERVLLQYNISENMMRKTESWSDFLTSRWDFGGVRRCFRLVGCAGWR